MATGLQALRFSSEQGLQVCYLRPPAQGSACHRLWLFFGGNGMRAQDWSEFIASWRPDDCLLLIEYPGYGSSAGIPCQASIDATTTLAIAAAGSHLGLERSRLLADCGVVGHSLGAAMALRFATSEATCSHVVLISPFTSLSAMTRRVVGWPLCLLLRENYDNAARLRELASRAQPPSVVIMHGTADTVIPVAMGTCLAGIVPGTQLLLRPGAGHNDVLDQLDLAVEAGGR